jgi:hypothetical protein
MLPAALQPGSPVIQDKTRKDYKDRNKLKIFKDRFLLLARMGPFST